MRRSHRLAVTIAALLVGSLHASVASAGAAGNGTAAVGATPTSIVAPGTFNVTANFAVTTPFQIVGSDKVLVSVILQGTDGVVTLGSPVPGTGLTNCTFPAPGRDYRCEIADPTVLGTYSITATVTATAAPTAGFVRVSSSMDFDALNGPFPVAQSQNIDVTISAPAATTTTTIAPTTTTAAPTTTTAVPSTTISASTTTDLGSGGNGLPDTGGRNTTPMVALAGVMVIAGSALVASRRRSAR